jgi:hypothetical protein
MKTILIIVLLALVSSSCNFRGSDSGANRRLTEDEKHRLYSAALAVSESPLESQIFKEVCQKIGIFNTGDGPNDNYMSFVAAHVDWALRPELQQFKQEISTREKAREYLSKHLPQ